MIYTAGHFDAAYLVELYAQKELVALRMDCKTDFIFSCGKGAEHCGAGCTGQCDGNIPSVCSSAPLLRGYPLDNGGICSTQAAPYADRLGNSIPNPRCAPAFGLVCPEGSCCSSDLQYSLILN
jgi:hypothetical protein